VESAHSNDKRLQYVDSCFTWYAKLLRLEREGKQVAMWLHAFGMLVLDE